VAFYPKAIRKVVARHDTPRTRDRGICHHVAATEASSLFSYFNIDGNPTSHFYVRKDGTVEQYVDTRFQAPAQLEGNRDMISIETAGGLSDRTADREPWSEAQVASLIALDAWIVSIHKGIPLRMMLDSKPTSMGFGYHKLGIDPYRVAGGERWSKAYGKICPGLEKIDQIRTAILPGVIRLLGTTTGDDELSAADVQAINDYSEQVCLQIQKHTDQVLAAAREDIKKYTAACTTSVKDYVRQTDEEQDILNSVASLKTDVAAVAGSLTTLAGVVADLKAAVAALPKG
jgi:hypothetical protein